MKKKKVNKADNRKKTIAIVGKYKKLISAMTEITQNHIEVIAEDIEKGIFFETACLSNGVDFETMNKLLRQHSTNELGKYAKDAFRQAEALAEKRFVEKWTNENNFNTKAIENFLTATNPKFSSRYRTEIKYNINILLDILKEKLDPNTFVEVLTALKSLDPYNVIQEYDSKLLN